MHNYAKYQDIVTKYYNKLIIIQIEIDKKKSNNRGSQRSIAMYIRPHSSFHSPTTTNNNINNNSIHNTNMRNNSSIHYNTHIHAIPRMLAQYRELLDELDETLKTHTNSTNSTHTHNTNVYKSIYSTVSSSTTRIGNVGRDAALAAMNSGKVKRRDVHRRRTAAGTDIHTEQAYTTTTTDNNNITTDNGSNSNDNNEHKSYIQRILLYSYFPFHLLFTTHKKRSQKAPKITPSACPF